MSDEIDLDEAAMSEHGVTADDVKRLLDTFGPEPLHDDLIPYLVENGGTFGGPGLYHPLVHDPFYNEHLNRQHNRMYLHKKEAIERAIAEGNWGSFIFLHEKPYRFDALTEMLYTHGVTDPKIVWPMISNVWTNIENVHENYDGWREVWDIDIPNRLELVMEDVEREAYAALPETIPVFRGVSHPDAVEGLSWTTDRKKAEWFAYRETGRKGAERALLAVGVAQKKDVLAHLLGRNESEIVVLPELVTIEKTMRLPVRKPKRG